GATLPSTITLHSGGTTVSPLVLDGGRPAPLTVILVSGNVAALAVPRSSVDGSMLPWGGVVRLEFTTDHDAPRLAAFDAELTDSGAVARWELTPLMVAEVGGAQYARITVD